MTFRLLLALLIANAIANVSDGDDVPALQFERLGGGGGGGFAYPVTMGWQFDVVQTVAVTQLGVRDAGRKGLSQPTPVAIWDSSGHTMTAVVVPAGEAAQLIGDFRYAAVKTVQLKPAQRYVIGAFYTPESKELTISANGGIDFTSIGPIRWVRARNGRTEEHAVPQARETRFDWLPGVFGPNFTVAEEASWSRLPKTLYHTRLVQPDVQWETVAVREQSDGFGGRPTSTLICLFATPNGKLTQVVLNGEPLGWGEDAFRRLATELEQINPRKENRPLMEIAFTAGVSAEDLRRAMKTAHYTDFDRYLWPSAARGCDVLKMSDAKPFQRAKDDRFIDPERFHDGGKYVEDRWTGLLWQKDGEESGKKNYYEAAAYAKQLELGELKNWRLPTEEEFAAIFPANFLPFTETHYNTKECCVPGEEYPSYWTSQGSPANDSAVIYQWYAKGGGNGCLAGANYAFVRCVHDPIKAKPAEETAK